MADPLADRPYIAHPEYGVPEDKRNLIRWSRVQERFREDQNYWICTSSVDGKPHSRPTWGVFVEDCVCFGGGPDTRWSLNLSANPEVSVHLESGTRVVIAEGTVDRITETDDPRMNAIDDAYQAKYEMRHGPPIWVLKPKVVIAWEDFPKDMTRFRF